jgi:hypothetical protein
MKSLLPYGILLVLGVFISGQFLLIPLALGYVIVSLSIIKRYVR